MSIRRILTKLTAEEFIVLCSFFLVTVVSLGVTGELHIGRAGRIGNFFALICSCSLLIVGLHDVYTAPATMATLTLLRRILWRSLTVLRDWLPLYFALSMYTYLYGLVNAVNPVDRDSELLAIDRFLFGETPAILMQSWAQPWLTDVLSFCYLTMMFFPPLFLLCVHLRCSRQTFHEVNVGLMVICLLGYCGYVFVPAVGPAVYLAAEFHAPLEGGMLSAIGHSLIAAGRNPRDCFPSMHVAIPLLMLLFAYKYLRHFLVIGLPLFLGIAVSTLYLRYHYFIDLVAGVVLALFVCWVSPHLQRWWQRQVDGQSIPE